MNTEKLQYFIDLVHTGSFTKTGEKNHISQTSITQQIKSLEQRYDCLLIDRSKKPIEPTEAGKIFYKEAVRVLQQFDRLERKMEDFTTNLHRLRIQYASIIDINLFSNILSQMNTDEIPLYVIDKVPLKSMAENLKSEKYDLAIGFDSEFEDVPGIDFFSMYQGDYMIAVSEQHPLYNKDIVEKNELYRYPLVMLSPDVIGKSYHKMIERVKEDGFTPNVSKVVDDVETELFTIQIENLVAFFPDSYPMPVSDKKIKLIPILDNNHKYNIVFAYYKFQRNKTLTKLLNYVKSDNYKKNL